MEGGGIIFLRKERSSPRLLSRFCSYNHEDCEYFSIIELHTCMRKDIEGVLGLQDFKTNIYGLCSYLNSNKSHYIYAPEKTS